MVTYSCSQTLSWEGWRSPRLGNRKNVDSLPAGAPGTYPAYNVSGPHGRGAGSQWLPVWDLEV